MEVHYPPEPGSRFPLLSAFGMEGDVEDGLTDSRRQVLAADLRGGRGTLGVHAPRPHTPLPEPEGETSRTWLSPVAPEYRVVRRVAWFLDGVGRWVDPRIANEEVGDALERIHQVAGARAPAWVLYAMAGVSAFRVLTHAVQEALRRMLR
ncbi:hypothetical protein JQX13_16310 [Archangium violaceum]|uniref:hypothetical protein n=1 Tax=Archangium violaceum TaxID=83451 RepID=UPI00193C8566|nr:hypothetical protein [Archangium violaceum]QRK11495.1 hypothetical protein JQX13_16310 [Archangium violaceum]